MISPWWVGPRLEQDCLAMHTACPLLKPEPHVSNPKTDSRDHWIPLFVLPSVATTNNPRFSAFHYYLSLIGILRANDQT